MRTLILTAVILASFFLVKNAKAANQCDQVDWQSSRICVIAGATADPNRAVNSAHARSLALKTARVLAYEKMAEMWGGHGEKVTDPEEILPAIRRAAATGKVSIVNVEIDDVSLSPFIAGYANMIKPEKAKA